MSKRSSSSSSSGHCSDRPAKRPSHRQYLYVLLDNWERGCSIYRVGEDDFHADSDTDLDTRSPLARIEAQHPLSWSVATHGTKILSVRPNEGSPAMSGFDTKTMGVTVCPFSINHRSNLRPLYASVGDNKLFVMAEPILEVLGRRPPPDSEEPWSWSSTMPDPDIPFSTEDVTGYALHPDGRHLFVSVEGPKQDYDHHARSCNNNLQQGTYSLDTNTKRLEFRHHGEWTLPFKGLASYDGELDAWVGLCKERTGYVCSCDAPSLERSCESRPNWKVSKDKVFDHMSRKHRGATLVYMGGSRYCLVECCAHKDDERYAYPLRRVMKMCTFGLKYDKKGELRITGQRGRVYMEYKVDRERVAGPTMDPTAFWL